MTRTRLIDSLIEEDQPGIRWRIRRSGVRTWPESAETTAMVVSALRGVGIRLHERNWGSAANASSYHLDANFEDGSFKAETGNYWYGSRGAWITGPRALAFIAILLDREPSPRLLAELRGADPKIDEYIAERRREGALVFHIPHASTDVPFDLKSSFALSEADLNDEITRMTDHYTDDLAQNVLPAARRVIFPVSRLVVDPERFENDSEEPMSQIGMGAVYKRTSEGRVLREDLSPASRASLMTQFYRPHHTALKEAVDDALATHGRCLVLDIHSFPSSPLPYEQDQDPDRPDICLGTDEFHTAPSLTRSAVKAFEEQGFSVQINRPFAGALVPIDFYRSNPLVAGLMVEVNRRLYIDEDTAKRLDKFEAVKSRLGHAVRSTALDWLHRVEPELRIGAKPSKVIL